MRYVTPGFLEAMRKEYPAAFKRPEWTRMLMWLLFPGWVDEKTGNPILSDGVVRRIARMEGKRFNVNNWLKEFKSEVMPGLEIVNYDRLKGLARTGIVEWRFFLSDMTIKVNAELHLNLSLEKKLVNPVTGKAPTRRELNTIRQLKEEHAATTHPSKHPADFIFGASKKVSRRAFTTLFEKNWSQVIEKTEELPEPARTLTLRALSDLRYSQFRPPIYTASANTTRVFGDGLCRIKSEVRRTFMNDVDILEVDLNASQLAIASFLWGVPELEAFILDGGNWWQYLIDGCDVTPESKPVLKKTLYAFMYGQSAKASREYVASEGFIGLYDKFISLELVAKLKAGRNKRMALLKGLGGYLTPPKGTLRLVPGASVRSLLAQEGQAWELFMIEGLYDIPEGRLMLHLHDGIVVKVEDKEAYMKEAERIIEARGASVGIPAGVSVK